MKVEIYSRKNMEKRLLEGPLENTAVISFYDPPISPDDDYPPIDYTGKCRQVYSLALLDTDFLSLEDEGLTLEEYFPQAQELAAFIKAAAEQQLDFACQCEYGENRSAGCAAAILEYYEGRGITVFADYRYCPSQLIFNKLLSAFD